MISLRESRRLRLYVRFKYENEDHTIALTAKAVVASDEHVWFVFIWFYFLPRLKPCTGAVLKAGL